MILTGHFEEIKKGLDEFIKNGRLGFLNNVTVNVNKCENGLKINGKDAIFDVCYGEKADFFRAISILNGKLSKGEKIIDFSEKREINSNGIMIDCSRNAVLKVDAVKEMMRKISVMGHNMVMLYTEDTYKLDDYPYFGYMRGAYTKEELKERDSYALLFGIELIPCIQTLGHLAMALRWPFANEIKENFHVLLVDEEKTYNFIEAMIKNCSECFTTKKIHIGMDEAPSVGLGRYLDKHGYHERFELLDRHLNRVTDIAKKYDLKPMMWADMFFRIASKTREYYDMEIEFPKEIVENIPENLSMVYWDYGTTDENQYKVLMQKHKDLGKEVIFAGGYRTWTGLGINNRDAMITSRAALSACRAENIKNVFVTLWGDDGAETNIFGALAGIQLYAEYTYHESVTDEMLAESFYLTQGYNLSDFLALDLDVYPEEWCHTPNVYGGIGGATVSKNALYQDVLLGLFDKNFDKIPLPEFYAERLDALNSAEVPVGYEKMFDYYKQLLLVLKAKSHIGIRITKAYKENDKKLLKTLANELLELYSDMEILHKKLRTLWLSTNKPFGLERLDVRYGGNLLRIKVASERISEYVDGKIEIIEELEEERLMYGGESVKIGKSLVEDQFYPKFALPASEGFIAE